MDDNLDSQSRRIQGELFVLQRSENMYICKRMRRASFAWQVSRACKYLLKMHLFLAEEAKEAQAGNRRPQIRRESDGSAGVWRSLPIRTLGSSSGTRGGLSRRDAGDPPPVSLECHAQDSVAWTVGAKASAQEGRGLGGSPRSPDGRGWARGVGSGLPPKTPARWRWRFPVLHWAFP